MRRVKLELRNEVWKRFNKFSIEVFMNDYHSDLDFPGYIWIEQQTSEDDYCMMLFNIETETVDAVIYDWEQVFQE